METIPKWSSNDGPRGERFQDWSSTGVGETRLGEQSVQGPHQAPRRPDTLDEGWAGYNYT